MEIKFFIALFCIMCGVIVLATELHAGWIQDPDREGIDKEDKPLLALIEYLAFIGITWLLGAPLYQQMAITPLFPAVRWFRDYPLNLLIKNDFDYIGKNAFSDRVLSFFEAIGFSQHLVRVGFLLLMFTASLFIYLNHFDYA
ncbi:MAG: hypothetical protein AAF927_01580 [Bacteroidota bacterium]